VHADDTTQSALRQGTSPVAEETLCLAWVYPEVGLTPLGERPISLGRSTDSTVQLAGGQASRRHAQIVCRGKRHFIVDLESKNGCFQNGRRVTEAPLAEQDVVRCGEWLAVVTYVPTAETDNPAVVREIEPGVIAGPALRAAFERLSRVAESDLNVMLIGETGTGKEFFARALHARSGREGLVPINCASIPEPLADAYFFGYKKGAFTGATHDQIGLFQSAAGGTLFLDELDELPLGVQPKLLRALQESRVAPIGRIESVAVDVRIVCAAQQSPEHSVQSGLLRADLYARLNGVQIQLPPLRARREDILAIFRHALTRHWSGPLPAIDPDLAELLLLYSWPLNARDVVHCARRISVEHARERVLHKGLLPPSLTGGGSGQRELTPFQGKNPESSAAAPDARLLGQLLEALRETSGNVSLAAKKLHISRQRAYRLLERRYDAWGTRGNG
jgi:transcriptional regulator with PAS, ATPase and Fis domain